MKRLILILAWAFSAESLASAQTMTTYFPQIAAGVTGDIVWNTHMAFVNPAPIGTSPANVTLTLTKSDGTPHNVAHLLINMVTNVAAGAGKTITLQMSGGQSRFFAMNASSVPLSVGYARVTSSAPVTATSVFISSFTATGTGIGEAGVAASHALSRQAIFVVLDEEADTAIAVANPNSATVNVTFTLHNTGGGVHRAPVIRMLQANNQSAFFVSELFPDLSDFFVGTIRISTSDATPVSATTLLFHPDAQFGGLPIVPLP